MLSLMLPSRTEKIGDRITLVETPTRLEIYIASPKNWFVVLLFVPIEFIVWLMLIWLMVVRGDSGAASLVLIWAFGLAYGLYAWFWNVFGRETLILEGAHCLLQDVILGYGFRTKQLRPTPVVRWEEENLSFFDGGYNQKFWGFRGYSLTLTAETCTWRYGLQLPDLEAQLLVGKITAWQNLQRPTS